MTDGLPSEFLRTIENDPRNCVLLVGAGLSATNVRQGGAGLPDWKTLVSSMVNELATQQKVDSETLHNLEGAFNSEDHTIAAHAYLQVAGLYKSKTRGDQFADFLREQLDPRDIIQSGVHAQILRAHFRGIMTTNFDFVFESQSSFLLQPLVYPQALEDYHAFDFGFFFKPHGCIRYTPNPHSNLVLTEDDFARLSNNDDYKNIIRTIFASNPVLTVGYSLRDPDFLALLEDMRRFRGMRTIYSLMKLPAMNDRDAWRDKGVEIVPYSDHSELFGMFERLADKLNTYIAKAPSPEPGRLMKNRQDQPRRVQRGRIQERRFLEATQGPTLKLGKLDLQCKLFPGTLWKIGGPRRVYLDDPESRSRICLNWKGISLPENTLATLISEIDQTLSDVIQGNVFVEPKQLNILKEVYQRLTTEGSNPYPRLVGIPRRIRHGGSAETLQVDIGPSRFGVALIEEKRLDLDSARVLRGKYILNSLAVRVALVSRYRGRWWVEFHQRKGGPNATYKDAWDVSAAGYVDPQRHKDPEDRKRVSPWQACAHELSEELGIPTFELPHRDKYFFMGVGRNEPTGQLDLLAFCEAASVPDSKRPLTARVRAFDRCLLDPEHISEFVAAKRKWVPTALLTLALMLETEHFGFSRSQIEEAFSPLAEQVDLRP